MNGRVGLDMDGVLYSWDHAVRAMMLEEFGIAVPTSTTWTFIKDFAGTKVWRWLWSHPGNVERMFGTGHAYPGAVAGAKRLYELADEVWILTAGPDGCEEPKRAWLEARGIPFDRLVRYDHGESKLAANCGLYIDDNPALISELAASRRAALGILVDRPWNRGREAPPSDPRWCRARGWQAIVARAEDALR